MDRSGLDSSGLPGSNSALSMDVFLNVQLGSVPCMYGSSDKPVLLPDIWRVYYFKINSESV
jgi:hypothetical protein